MMIIYWKVEPSHWTAIRKIIYLFISSSSFCKTEWQALRHDYSGFRLSGTPGARLSAEQIYVFLSSAQRDQSSFINRGDRIIYRFFVHLINFLKSYLRTKALLLLVFTCITNPFDNRREIFWFFWPQIVPFSLFTVSK